MTLQPPRLLLASSSPRRRELVNLLSLPVGLASADVDECRPPTTPPDELVRDLALTKARAVAGDAPAAPVVGADTTVFLDGERLEKPTDAADAVRMLRRLCGATHQVYTGVAVVRGESTTSDVVVSHVTMQAASEETIRAYVATGEPLDKASAYGIQSGHSLVASVDGCYTNVVGLPLCALALLLARAGVPIAAGPPPCGYRTERRCPHPIWRG